MKISALRLFNVKRFANRGVAIEGIGDGVNVLCVVNEFGIPKKQTPHLWEAGRMYAGRGKDIPRIRLSLTPS